MIKLGIIKNTILKEEKNSLKDGLKERRCSLEHAENKLQHKRCDNYQSVDI